MSTIQTTPIENADRAGYVYAIRNDESQAVKVGFSASPFKRLCQLQTGSPAPLRILCAIPAFGSYEATMHNILASYRRHGEWFDDSDGSVSDLMVGTAAFLIRAGLTIGDIEALAENDPESVTPPRKRSEESEAYTQGELDLGISFSGKLQDRYPLPRKKGEEPAYKLRLMLTPEEREWNALQLHKSGLARIEHANALRAEGQMVGVA